MWTRRLAAGAALAGLAVIGIMAKPAPAEAWWRGGWCCGVGIGIVVPPVVVAPPPAYYPPPPAYYAPPAAYYAPPPAYYAPPPQRVWVPAHWQGNVWVPGHWA